MIRLRYSIIMIVLFCVSLGIFGVINKSSYTNTAGEDDFMDTLYVAEIPEDFAVAECEQLTADLPKCAYIFRVKALAPIDYRYEDGRQKVEILEVYSGNEIQPGDKIYITSPKWSLELYDNVKSVGRGFVNVLDERYEYLVFCTTIIESVDKKVPTYQLYSKTYIAPVFCYTDLENVIVEPGDMGTYIPYIEVKENEFFACTERALQVWQTLKREMISQYSKK